MASAKNSHFIDLTKINLFETIYDVKYKEVIAWKEQNPGRKAIALFPVYVPSELIHSYNHLPVNIYGGGEEVSISHADAILGSFICSISKSTTELLLSQEEFQKAFDGFVFPFICDVARNLSGIFGRRSTKPAYMLHLAQNFQSPSGITFLAKEYQRLVSTLFPDENLNLENLRESIKLFNHNRQLHRDLYQLRWEKPWNVPLKEMYEIMRVGSTLTVETHNRLLQQKMDQIKLRDGRTKDAIRVVVTGNFCEQPPLDFIDLIEQVGCYVIDDDFMIGRRFISKDVNPDAENILEELAKCYIVNGAKIATRFHQGEKGTVILDRVKQANANGVIFLTAKFCEPALDDLVLQQQALYENNIPYVHIEFEERGSGYELIRLSLETFVESMLFD